MKSIVTPLIAAIGLVCAQASFAIDPSVLQKSAADDADPAVARLAAAGHRPVDARARARAYFTDLEVQDQDGRRLRFYSDVLAGKVVVINFIYTRCEDACPLITKAILDVKEWIPEIFGKQVHFVSISLDPVNDTPERLRAFAESNGADVEGWTFLTGSRDNISLILKRLGQCANELEAHSRLLIAGNVPAKRWSRIRAESPSLAIAERIRALAAAGMQASVGN